jgi:hypothetical protein
MRTWPGPGAADLDILDAQHLGPAMAVEAERLAHNAGSFDSRSDHVCEIVERIETGL